MYDKFIEETHKEKMKDEETIVIVTHLGQIRGCFNWPKRDIEILHKANKLNPTWEFHRYNKETETYTTRLS